MEGTYDVVMGSEPVGKATVTRQGLYFRFSCRCRLSGEVMQSLWVRWEGGCQRLGLLTPMDGQFGLETKLPVKQFGQGAVHFFLQPRHAPMGAQFHPVRPEEPFAYLHRLENAYLATQNQQMCIVFPDEK